MAKKLLFFLIVLINLNLSAQKRKSRDIMQSTDIAEIENFLKTAHPEDPRRTVLKPKLISLKNAAWTKGAKSVKPMQARPIMVEVPHDVMKDPNSPEAAEFKKLITETSKQHSDKTVQLLNNLFDQNITKREATILVQNNSDCNMILRFSGRDFYNLAVPAHGENSLVVNIGTYNLNSNICDTKYASTKQIKKSMVIILNNPVVNIQPKKSK